MSYYDGPGQAGEPWGQAGYDPDERPDAYDRPPEPPEEPAPAPTRGSTALVALLVSVLVLVLCGGGVAALYLIGAKDRTPTASGTGSAPASTPTKAASPSASASPSFDPNSIIKGQCVVNEGTQDAPVLRPAACGPGTFQVLARFDGTIDKNKCKSVPGSNYHYFYDTSPDTLDFVLCLKKQ
jgi:hypothetical protein